MTPFRANVADGRQGTWNRDNVLEALREYAELYGGDFPAAAFSPAAAKRGGRPDLVDRYYTKRPSGGSWPSLNVIKEIAGGGSFNAARAAIGLAPNSTGPARGRRKPGEAEPILNVRERVRYVSDEKLTRNLEDARVRAIRAEEREMRLRARVEALTEELEQLRATGKVVVHEQARTPAPAPKTKIKTVTKTKMIKVKDTKSLQRLGEKLADSEASRRAVQDQLNAEQRDRNRERRRIADLETQLTDLRDAAAEAKREARRAIDRLTAADTRIENLQMEVTQARTTTVGAQQAAMVNDAVRRAEERAREAEVRAARAEREMAEQASAITGEVRRLTAAELADLRGRGPAGEAVMEKALKGFMAARRNGGREPMRRALRDLARAAVMWSDRL